MNHTAGLVSCLSAVVAFSSSVAARDASEIVRAAWDNWRGLSSFGQITMVIHRPSWERSMTMQTWTRGAKHSLVRVTAPRKDAGNGSLMIDDAMWSYSPKVNRVIKVPSSMMGMNWMGSDFSNKDLSRADDIVDRYTHSLLKIEKHATHSVFVIEAIPQEDAAVVWGREVLRIRDDDVLLAEAFYDQDGVLVKTLKTLEVGKMGGRSIAIRQRMSKTDTEDEWTEIRFDSIAFDVDLPDYLFTRSNLRNPRR